MKLMNSALFYENVKILKSRLIIWIYGICVLSILLSISGLFFTIDGSPSKNEYIRVYNEAKGVSKDSVITWADQMYNENISVGEDKILINPICFAYREYRKHFIEIDKYKEYIDEIVQKADDIVKIAKTDSFISRNSIISKQIYSMLANLRLHPICNVPVDFITNNSLVECAILLSSALISIHAVAIEKTSGTRRLILTTKKGKKTFYQKYIAVTFQSVVLTVFVKLLLIICTWILFGVEDFVDPIQSVYGYIACPYKLSIWEYIICINILKLIQIALISAISIFLATLIPTTSLSMVILSLQLAIEYVIYHRINFYSVYIIFKEINITALYNITDCFISLRNTDVLGYALNTIVLRILITIFIAAASYYCGVFSFSSAHWEYVTIKSRHFTLYKPKSVKGWEIFKFIRTQKVIPITILSLLMITFYITSLSYRVDVDEYHYREYTSVMRDMDVMEQKKYVESELATIDAVDETLTELNEDYNEGRVTFEYFTYKSNELQMLRQCENALIRINNQLMILESTNDLNGSSYKVLNTTIWTRIIPLNDPKRFLDIYIMTVFVLIISLTGMVLYDRETTVEQLYISTSKGSRYVNRMKRSIAVKYGLSLVILVNVLIMIYITQVYGIPDCEATFYEIYLVTCKYMNMNMVLFFMITLGVELIGVSIIILLMIRVAGNMQKYVRAVICEIGVFIFPVIALRLLIT